MKRMVLIAPIVLVAMIAGWSAYAYSQGGGPIYWIGAASAQTTPQPAGATCEMNPACHDGAACGCGHCDGDCDGNCDDCGGCGHCDGDCDGNCDDCGGCGHCDGDCDDCGGHGATGCDGRVNRFGDLTEILESCGHDCGHVCGHKR